MGSFSAEGAVICILSGVCSACGGEIGETRSEKGKEIRKYGVEDAEGKENLVAEPLSDPHHVYLRSLLLDLTRLLPF